MSKAVSKINENPNLDLSINLEYSDLIDEDFIRHLEAL
jgi:hypothetical protein